ncbi:MAG: AbrB/MazE/SpoVT family DNA-binding domain-containing protein [Gammaproteobacteria bacterium]|nr:MAG: AbrB/MazE/SpoVT family DNA-binding domain-containing protein [Gammaproteobacteria bacterium]
MRVTTKGQVTIPKAIRERLGIAPYSEVEFVVEGDRVILRKIAVGRPPGRELIRHLRGRATVCMSTDEIMALTRGG